MYRNRRALASGIFIYLMTAVLPRQCKPAFLQYRDYFSGGNSRQLCHTFATLLALRLWIEIRRLVGIPLRALPSCPRHEA